MTPDFQAFGPDHLAALAVILGVSLALPISVNRLRSPAAAERFGTGLGFLILLAKMAELAWYVSQEVPWPWYILVLVPVAWGFLSLWYLPFWWLARRGHRA